VWNTDGSRFLSGSIAFFNHQALKIRLFNNHIMRQFLLASALLCGLLSSMAQSPQLMNYQAVVRNTQGQPVQNKTVNLQFQIHDGTIGGNVVFTETDTATTNQFGLATVQIGNSTSLGNVTWGNGTKYLQVGVDVTGGNTFADMGTTQLLSVPYALHANNSDTASYSAHNITPSLTIDALFGGLNSNTATATTTGAVLGAAVMTFTKLSASSTIELLLNTIVSAGTFTGGATVLGISLKIDGVVANYTSQQWILQSGASQYVNIDAIFSSLAAGTHTVTVIGTTDVGTSANVTLDTGGYGGTVMVKEIN
jgi:hypothetical protein